MNKAMLALKYKADAIMDLSVSGDTQGFRKRLVREVPVMIGSVPIYDTLTRTRKPTEEITLDDWFETVEIYAKNGIDFLTSHADLTKKCVESIRGLFPAGKINVFYLSYYFFYKMALQLFFYLFIFCT